MVIVCMHFAHAEQDPCSHLCVCTYVCVNRNGKKEKKWGEVDGIYLNGEKSLNEENTGLCIFINDCLTCLQG